MHDIIFIGDRIDAARFRAAGILCYAPAARRLAERVDAERARCRVLLMTADTYNALPPGTRRTLREGTWPILAIVPPRGTMDDAARINVALPQVGTAA